MKTASIGKLELHPDVPDEWLVSKKLPIPFFNGKEMNFTFVDLDIKSDKSFLSEADEALKNFLQLGSKNRLEISSFVFEHYKEIVGAVGEEDIIYIEKEEDVWRYVYPYQIIVDRRHRRDRDIYIQIHCNCEWEMEHGLQLVFRQGKKLTRISDIDGHSTEADAYNKSDADDELLSKF